MREKIRNGNGFIAALDQSGGSTPKALKGYGIEEGAWSQRRGDVRPHPPDALADHHFAVVRQRQGDRRDPVRADDGRRGRRQADPAGADRFGRRAVHQDRQGAGGGSERRSADEAEPRARRAADQGQGPRRVRHQGAVGDQPRQPAGDRRRGCPAVRGRAPGAQPRHGPDHRAGSEHQEPGARCGRPDPAQGDPQEPGCDPGGPAGDAQADDPGRAEPVRAAGPAIPKVLRVVALSGGFSREEACRELAKNPG